MGLASVEVRLIESNRVTQVGGQLPDHPIYSFCAARIQEGDAGRGIDVISVTDGDLMSSLIVVIGGIDMSAGEPEHIGAARAEYFSRYSDR
jgi:hypothetical protein